GEGRHHEGATTEDDRAPDEAPPGQADRDAAGAGAPGPDRVSATIMRVTPKAPQKRACTA
ncbi:MAG TPA: hypothetical protein VN323_21540, partial [Candidatus Dormibacteraeota bacterium]|nr:hypothetical protein [Candidatus Dormibacteraeota bacterium]